MIVSVTLEMGCSRCGTTAEFSSWDAPMCIERAYGEGWREWTETPRDARHPEQPRHLCPACAKALDEWWEKPLTKPEDKP